MAAAIAELKVCTSTTPTPTDWDNVNIALRSASLQAVHVIADLSVVWKDKKLWYKAFNAGKGDSNVAAFGIDRVYRGLEIFGFPTMMPMYAVLHDHLAYRLTLRTID